MRWLSSASSGSTLPSASSEVSSTSWRGFPAMNNSSQSLNSLAGTSLHHINRAIIEKVTFQSSNQSVSQSPISHTNVYLHTNKKTQKLQRNTNKCLAVSYAWKCHMPCISPSCLLKMTSANKCHISSDCERICVGHALL